MAVKIGSARSSYGDTTPGDQNGKEVSRQDWYKHSLGWVMLRPIIASNAEDIARDMEYACDNSNVGYHQGTRYTLYDAAKLYSFDISKVSKPVNTDCSALVRVCVNYAGIPVGNIRTTDLVNKLMATGRFEKHEESKYCCSSDYLKRGDILCTKSQGHVVVVLSNGSKAVTTAEKKYITITGGSVNVRKGAGTSYGIVRIVREGMKLSYSETTTVSGTKWYHIADGWVSGKYAKEQ